jgi:hypothetical protein
MHEQAKHRWSVGGSFVALLLVAGGAFFGAVADEAIPGFLDGLGIPIRSYAKHGGQQVVSVVHQLDGQAAAEAKAEIEKCEETRRVTVASAKADYRKANGDLYDCSHGHDEPWDCYDAEKAMLAAKARLEAVKAKTCQASAAHG